MPSKRGSVRCVHRSYHDQRHRDTGSGEEFATIATTSRPPIPDLIGENEIAELAPADTLERQIWRLNGN
ncbi:hypothetical protein C493_11697 [Natronolimnohabitans innermongolicus JCM 12255]|uniref:Uncharacterized protein n=1 Tax=Natronolimnohabitans innermongolicus JCM 12255 TaxID=1227499 RepID=L9WZW0_9EURY|nr:hypothetical protein C493_11697 [Natronolimnohabitans innermongolicus JCM 12255]